MVSVLEIEDVGWGEAVADFITEKRGGTEENTALFYQTQLRQCQKWAEAQGVALQDFRARNMRLYLAHRREKGLSDQTVRSDAVAVRNFFKFCGREKYVASDPLRDFQVPKAAKAFVKNPSDDEIRQLLAGMEARRKSSNFAASRFTSDKTRHFFLRRDYAIITGLLETAARIGEVLNLRLDDYDKDRKQVVFRETKGDTPRTVPISDAWIEVVERWLRVRPKTDSKYLFITIHGEPVDVRVFSRQFKRYCVYAGVEGVTLHSLRHHALTILAKSDLWAASQIAGHKDLRVTRAYLHGDPDHVRQAHADAAPLSRILLNARSEKAKRKRLV